MLVIVAVLVAACLVQPARLSTPSVTNAGLPALVFSPTFEDRGSKVILSGNQTVALKANTLTVRNKHSSAMQASLDGDVFLSCTMSATKLAVYVQGRILTCRHRVIVFDFEKGTVHSLNIGQNDKVRLHGDGQKVSYLKSNATLVTRTVDGRRKTGIREVASFDASDKAGLLYIQGGVLKRDYQQFVDGNAYQKVCVDSAGHVMAWDGSSLRVLDAAGKLLGSYMVRTVPVNCHFDGHVVRLLDEHGSLRFFERYRTTSIYSNISQPIVTNSDLTQFSSRDGIATFASKSTSWYSDDDSPIASHILQIISEYADFPVAKRTIAIAPGIPDLPALSSSDDIRVAVNRSFLNCRDSSLIGHHLRGTSNAPVAIASLLSHRQLRIVFSLSLKRPPLIVTNYPDKLEIAVFSQSLAYMFALSNTGRFDVFRTRDGVRIWAKSSVYSFKLFEAHGFVLLQNRSKEAFKLLRIHDGAFVRRFFYENSGHPMFRVHLPYLYLLDIEHHSFERFLIVDNAGHSSSPKPSSPGNPH